MQKKKIDLYTGVLKSKELINLVTCLKCGKFINHIKQKHMCTSHTCDVKSFIDYTKMLDSIEMVSKNSSEELFQLNKHGYKRN